MVDLPVAVVSKAKVAGAAWWIDELADLVASLEHEWSIVVGAVYPDSTEAYVTQVTTHDGQAAVLKLIVPRTGDVAGREIAVLERANGDGCVRLLCHDAGRGALLLERLGPSLTISTCR